MLIRYNPNAKRYEAILARGDAWAAEYQAIKAAGGWGFDGNSNPKVWHTTDPKKAAHFAECADESARAQLGGTIEEVKTEEAAKITSLEESRAVDSLAGIPCPASLSYLPYQRAGIAYAMKRDNTLFADEMGLGKTIQAIGVSNAAPDEEQILIVCPASLKLNWAREWVKWDVKDLPVTVVTHVTRKLKKASAEWGRGRVSFLNPSEPSALPDGVVIINYDILAKWSKLLNTCEWDMLIVDEAHKVKNPDAKRTKNLLGERKWNKQERRWEMVQYPITAFRRLFLTGTPIVNRPVELWPLVLAMDPEGLGRYKSVYERRYCGAHYDGYGYDKSGATNLEELQIKLREKFMIRRLKADVLKELPPKRRQIIVLEPDGDLEDLLAKETAAYEAVQQAQRDGRVVIDGVNVPFEELAAVRKEVALAKVPFVIDHVKAALENEDKVVIFGHHHEVLDRIAAEFGDAAVMVDGRTSLTDRDAAVIRFQNDPACRVFVGSIMAAGVGLTLTASSTVIFAELDWVPGNVTQAEDRCHRIGQVDSVLVQHIVLSGSLDGHMVEIIISKQEVIDQALDKHVEAAPEYKPVKTEVVRKPARPASDAAPEVPPTTKDGQPITLTPAQIESVHCALKYLAAVCDGAELLDGQGFNRQDTDFGKKLAAAPNLTPRMAFYGRRLVQKYQRQLDPALVTACGISPVHEIAY